jgi:hypothetical protein
VYIPQHFTSAVSFSEVQFSRPHQSLCTAILTSYYRPFKFPSFTRRCCTENIKPLPSALYHSNRHFHTTSYEVEHTKPGNLLAHQCSSTPQNEISLAFLSYFPMSPELPPSPPPPPSALQRVNFCVLVAVRQANKCTQLVIYTSSDIIPHKRHNMALCAALTATASHADFKTTLCSLIQMQNSCSSGIVANMEGVNRSCTSAEITVCDQAVHPPTVEPEGK